MRYLLVFLLALFILPVAAAERPDCAERADKYDFGTRVGEVIQPIQLRQQQYRDLNQLFNFLASRRQRHGTMKELSCSRGEVSTEEFRVSASFEFDHENVLFIRGEALSRSNSVKQLGALRLKLLPESLQLWGLNAGWDIDLQLVGSDRLVYREVRRTRRANGGFNERELVTEIRREGSAVILEERIYINASLFGWRLWNL